MEKIRKTPIFMRWHSAAKKILHQIDHTNLTCKPHRASYTTAGIKTRQNAHQSFSKQLVKQHTSHQHQP
ncbi:MAG: hypothetical protein SOR93_11535 [Clostridiales Family XIII bacterium]|uniref:hypothetical protein n=1 Tax=Hominibacterium faecale TaxID=2839743 RepID=UPI001D0FDA24|nr:hypothetical protein [Hominibacterium faecale]MCC2865867.1 hypothetical protein [Anaerovorax odorimutans]MCI7301097.1 hypothetical protein [Clostridia bacterium]MDY3011865.1 hypothetical protein [Clostridiales Family XIII bacterium]